MSSLQSLKTFFEINVTEDGIITDFNDEHPLNESYDKNSIDDENIISLKEEHSLKQLDGISFTSQLSLKQTLVNDKQCSNEDLDNKVNVLGISISSIQQFSKQAVFISNKYGGSCKCFNSL